MRRILFALTVLCLCPLCTFAAEDAFRHLIANYQTMGGQTKVLDETERYARVSLSDSAFVEMYIAEYITVVYTVCAPVCSSCARVYNKEWEFLYPIEPPFKSIFPLATMDKETGQIIWKDNNNWEY